MARKRKIPARKHHGVRDPLKQLEEREKRLNKITNNPPEREDQKMTFKLAQFKKLVEDTKDGKKIKRIHKGIEDRPRHKVTSVKKIGRIQQLKEETDEDYLKRVNRITTQSLREAQYEAKYGVNVVHNPKTGEISIKKKPKNEIDELLKERQNNRGKRTAGKTKQKDQGGKPLNKEFSRELIKQFIKDEKEEKAKSNLNIEEYKHDIIPFGEVVHAPPAVLTLPRRAQKSETVPRPGKKSSLLLKAILTDDKNHKKEKLESKSRKTEKVKLTGKRKNLPLVKRKMIEDEQTKFIEMYRAMKKSKRKMS